MKKIVLMLWGCALFIEGMAQTQSVDLESKPLNLRDRYYQMKTSSETYQDYKVIKENTLDGFWKITADSLSKTEKQFAQAQLKIDTLQNKLNGAKTELKSKSESVANIVFDGNHIRAFGIDFSKGLFLFLSLSVFVSLALIISFLLIRTKAINKLIKESKLTVTSVGLEFDEYKHKALDKQTKLARELQTERNKLSELGFYK